MKKSLRWFTLIEIMVSLTISWLIILWISYFITELNNKIISSNKKSDLYLAMNDFVDKSWIKRNLYSKALLFDLNPNYNALMLNNSNEDWWLLIWVVNNNATSSWYLRLDPLPNYDIYDNKVLWIKTLNKIQIGEILADSWSIYNMEFFDDNVFSRIYTKRLQFILYNSWNIVEMKWTFTDSFLPNYVWKNILETPSLPNYEFTLNF